MPIESTNLDEKRRKQNSSTYENIKSTFMRKPDCETVNRVRVARIPARDRVICVDFSSIPKNIFQNKHITKMLF